MKKLLILSILLFFITIANAQFYNGLQMNFGKNRVQYKPYNWRYYRYNSYDIYLYDRGLNFGKFVASTIEKDMNDMSNFFGIGLKDRVLFIVYNKLSEFRQSNIGLKSDNVDFNIGGQLQIIDNKVFIYYEGNHELFERQIRKVLAQLYINQALYGTAFVERLSSSALSNIPGWFEKGLVSYVAKPYNINTFNKLHDFINTHKRFNFNHLNEDDAVIVGHSFWYYIADTYGEQTISNIIYFAKISHNIKNAIQYVLGVKMNQITKDYHQFFIDKLKVINADSISISNQFKTKKKPVYQQAKLSPDGKKISYIANNQGRYKVVIYNLETNKKKVLYREGQKLQQIIEYTYPVIAWNNKGNIIAFTNEYESNVNLWLYNFDKEELRSIVLPNITKVLDFSFSPTNPTIVFSAVSDGFTDLFTLDMLTGQFVRLNYDLPDDLNPKFDITGRKIIFSSNRTADSLTKNTHFETNLQIGNNFDLFLYDFVSGSNQLLRLTNTYYSDETEPLSIAKDKYVYLSDSTGVENRFITQFDSAISFVDTAIHYRFFANSKQITNYPASILNQDFANNKTTDIFYYKKRFRIFIKNSVFGNYTMKVSTDMQPLRLTENAKIEKLIKQQQYLQTKIENVQKKIDSLTPVYQVKINSPDSSVVDINNYIFEAEKDTLFKKFYNDKILDSTKEKTPEDEISQLYVYHPTFFINDLMSQVDFSMLNQSYQPFTGGPFYFNPGFSLFTTVGVNEMFEDFKILGGFRYAANGSVEYLVSFENLKKRLDKQFVYHRQVLKNISEQSGYVLGANKTISNELIYLMRYPFNQVSSVRLSFIGKYDKITPLSIDYSTLTDSTTNNYYAGAKFEYIFDNTKELSLNLLEGVRYKIFGEFYQQVSGKYYYTTVFGIDMRYYKELFRNIIFATRFAGATSQGNGKVIFYLGGVDNWYDLSLDTSDTKYFDKRVRINSSQNYLFQAVATNLRGFPQNIRNGNSFVVSNTELRVPIVRFFAPYPINSDFWYNLQLVGFFDIGSAWAGWSPYDKKNWYNTIIEQRPPFTVTVDLQRPPLVYGYGFGFRSKIFGYFVRLDWAWGIEGYYHYPYKVYFSLSTDF